MKTVCFSLIIFVAVFIHGCSSRDMYGAIQKNAQSECRKVPRSERAECMDRVSESYDDYTKKREEVIQGK